jgi:hypothetical protein
MTQIDKTIIRLYRDGYMAEAIARAIGEDRSYVECILVDYLGQAMGEMAIRGSAPAVGGNS